MAAKANYVQLPTFEEYREMFKEHFAMKREDGILQVSMTTKGDQMYWSGSAHRAISQLIRTISMDHDNEVLIWTHKGEDWLKNTDPEGWERYEEERFDHQYFDDTNLIKNWVFDLEIPTIGAQVGPGFHWDTVMMCDITIASEDCRWDDFHFQYGLVPGDGMGMLMQHFLGNKRANYLMYTSRQFTAQQALEWGWINEICPKGKVIDRAWELARLIKSVPREPRTITANLCKRPLARTLLHDLRLHTVSEQYSTMIKLSQNDVGSGADSSQQDEKSGSLPMNWRYAPDVDTMLQPQSLETWNYIERARAWAREKEQDGQKA